MITLDLKKATVTGGILLGLLLTALLVWLIGFPGLTTYFSVKREYEHIDRTITAFQTVYVPESFQSVKSSGLRFSVPASYSLSPSGHGYYDEYDQPVLIVSKIDTADLSKYLPDDPWSDSLYTEADYRHYFRTVDVPYSDMAAPTMKLLWYLRGTLNAETCLHLRGQDLKVFREFAVLKENGWNNESTWELPLAGCTAYVTQGAAAEGVLKIGMGLPNALWSVIVYPNDSSSEYISMTIGLRDANTARQIISSISYAE